MKTTLYMMTSYRLVNPIRLRNFESMEKHHIEVRNSCGPTLGYEGNPWALSSKDNTRGNVPSYLKEQTPLPQFPLRGKEHLLLLELLVFQASHQGVVVKHLM